jgi:type II secretory pathway component GspD/PulD (secretin)
VVASAIAFNGRPPLAAAQDEPPQTPAPEAARPAADTAPAAPAAEIRFNFADRTVTELATFLASFLASGMSAEVLLPPDLPDGTIRWSDPRPYTLDEALALADAVLRTRGQSLSRSEARLVVSPLDPAARQPRELSTHVVGLLRPGSSALVEQLRPVFGTSAMLASVGTPQTAPSAVITATSDETCLLARALFVALDRVDLEGDVVAVPLRRTGAAEARALLFALLDADGADDAAMRLAVADDPRGGLLLRGERQLVERALRILAAIDGDGSAPPPAAEPRTSIQRGEFAALRIAAAAPDAAAAAARHVLPTEVGRNVRAVPSPDGRALLLAGDAADLALWRAALDATSPLPAVVGAGPADGRAVGLLREPERERALLRVNGDPEALASLLAASASAVMPQRGSDPPVFEPLAALGAILASGEPGIVDFASTVLDAVDSGEIGARVARTIAVPAADGAALVAATRGAAAVGLDASRRVARASGSEGEVDHFERSLLEERGLRQRHRIARVLETGALGAKGAERNLATLLGAAVPVETRRTVPLAEVRALPSSEALYVAGEPAQISLVARLLSAHDAGLGVFTAPLRLLEIRCGDAVRVADSLRRRFDSRDEAAQRARPVFVEGDRAGNALSVAMHPDMLAEVARAIDEFDPRDDGTTAQPREIFSSTLAQSDPLVVARALNGLFPAPPMPRDAAGRALEHLREPRTLHASGDSATRMVWVESSRDRAVAIDALVGVLDRLALPPDARTRLFRLERGDIARVLQNLRDLAARGSLSRPATGGGGDGRADAVATRPIVIDADAASRTIVVVGDDDAFARTEEVLAQLGVLPDETAVRVIDAGAVDPAQLGSRALKLAALEPREGEAASIAVTVDAGRGVLSAVGDEAALERFTEACRTLVPRAGEALAAALLDVANRDAAEIAATLEGSFMHDADRAIVRAYRANGIAVAGTRTETMLAEAIVRSLDATTMRSQRIVATVPCRDAALPAEAIARWFATRGADLEDPLPVEVRATPDADGLVVAGSPAALRRIETMVRELGREVAGGDPRAVTILPLRSADAVRMAALLDVRSAADTDGAARASTVRADAARGALLVSGESWRTEMTVGLVRQLDRADGAAAPARMVRVESKAPAEPFELRAISLATLRVERAAGIVRSMLGGEPLVGEGGQRSRPIVAVGEDAVANRMLVAAPPAYAALADALVARLERAGSVAPQGEAARLSTPWIECAEFAVVGVDAEVAARVVEAVIGDRARWTSAVLDAHGAGETILAPRVVADPGEGRIFVSAPPQLIALAEAVVARLSAERAVGERWEMRVYPVAFDKLGAAVNAVEQALAARAPKNAQPPRIDLVAVPEGEALVAAGEPSWLDVVDSAVRSLEVRAPRDAARVRMVSLRNTEAFGLAGIARDFLTGVLSDDADAGASKGLVQALAAPGSNSVALLATPVALDLSEEILLELDVPPGVRSERSLRLYELSNGEAAVAAKSILDLFETDDSEDPLPTVRVQPSRNSLLVRATDKQRPTVDGLVAKIDATAPARARVVRAIEVSRGAHSVADVADAARRLGALDGRMTLALDASRRALVTFGTVDEIARLEGVVAQIERYPGEPGELGADARIFELPASAEPRALAALASAMLGELASGGTSSSSGHRGNPDAHVVLLGRGDTRAVACIASDEGARMAAALLGALARAQNAGPVAMQSCVVDWADASRVAAWLRDEASRADGTLRVVESPLTRSILLLGTPLEMDAAAREIARLDGRWASAHRHAVLALPLRTLPPAEAVALLEDGRPFDGSGPVLVAEPVSGSVVLSGALEEAWWQTTVLSALDDPAVRRLPPFEAIRVTGQRASAVARAVLEAVNGADPARRDALRLVADDERGVLYVRVAPMLASEVRAALDAALAAPAEAAP